MTPHDAASISIPLAPSAPRGLTDEERVTLTRVADTLIPPVASAPRACDEKGFWEALAVALDARSDAFDDIVATLEALSASPSLWEELQRLDLEQPSTFQALSTVIAGAWLLTPGVRDRIGYHGQQVDRAGLEEAADEIGSGLLDAVLERSEADAPRWVR